VPHDGGGVTTNTVLIADFAEDIGEFVGVILGVQV
jgi:hypothetical protein